MTTFWHRTITGVSVVAALAVLTACGSSEDDASSTAPEQPEAQESAAEETQESADESSADAGEAGALTMAEVEANNSTESCWTVVDGVVYDVTAWIDQHPGGAGRIEQLCGTDGTAQFQGQHGSQDAPEDQLSEFELGELDG